MDICNLNSSFIKMLSKKHPNIYYPKNNTSYSVNRKYIGIAIESSNFCYFIPISFGKDKDYYVDENGLNRAKKDTLYDIYIKHIDKNTSNEVIDIVLKYGSLIPVPKSELSKYDIKKETNAYHRAKLLNLLRYIRVNKQKIKSHALKVRYMKTSNPPLDYKKLQADLCRYSLD